MDMQAPVNTVDLLTLSKVIRHTSWIEWGLLTSRNIKMRIQILILHVASQLASFPGPRYFGYKSRGPGNEATSQLS